MSEANKCSDYAALDSYVFNELDKEREREASTSMGGVFIGEIKRSIKTDCSSCAGVGAFPTSGPSDRMCSRCLGLGWVWKL